MNGIAIVAVPSDGDPIWDWSSEKVPHLTLLMLGESIPDLTRVQEYVKHASDTALHKMYLESDRRGELGPKKADVLFFKSGFNIKMLETFRAYLLDNDSIRKSYESVEQFPTWTPHLTLGFPATPAKPRPNDRFPDTTLIHFDRIAMWTGDFSGPEFPLKETEWSVSMSDKGAEFLSHFGVKGMKWGASRAKTHHESSSDHKLATDAKAKAKRGGTKTLSNHELQAIVNRMNLEQQYGRLKANEPSKFSKGQAAVKTILGVAKTAQEVYSVVNSPMGKEIQQALKK